MHWCTQLKLSLRGFLFFFNWSIIAFNVVLISAVQCESAVSIHISPSSCLSLPPQCPSMPLGHHRALRWAPCAVQQLPIAHLFHTWCVYMSMLLSQFVTPSLSPLCPHVHFPRLRLYSCRAKGNHLYHLSRFHIHTLIYGICFSLSDLTAFCRTSLRGFQITFNSRMLLSNEILCGNWTMKND